MPTIRRILTDPDGTVHVWTPHRYPDGTYKLARPQAGFERNVSENAVSAVTLEEVVELIGRRHSLRMSEGGSGPVSLIGPDSITIS